MTSQIKKNVTGSSLLSKTFWITIFTLAAVTIILSLLPLLSTTNPTGGNTGNSASREIKIRPAYEIQSTILQSSIIEASEMTNNQVADFIDRRLDQIFWPVYAAIPGYVEFHYSVVGEYLTLYTGATNAFDEEVATEVEKRLYAGFDRSVERFSMEIDDEYGRLFQINLNNVVTATLPQGTAMEDLGEITTAILDDTLERATIGVPVSGMGSMGGAVAAKSIGKAVFAKTTAKIGIKVVSKTGMALSGAVIGSAVGPVGTIAGGIVGGVAGWFLADAVIVNVDQWFNSSEFEQELKGYVDEHKIGLRDTLIAAVENKTASIQDFTTGQLRSL